MTQSPTILIVPGLRDHAAGHWQTLLMQRLPKVAGVPPMGRADMHCARRVAAIEKVAHFVQGPLIAVAHSGGCITLAHWLAGTKLRLAGALMAAPPDFESPLPEGFPTLDELDAGGWLPVPRQRLPCPTLVAASRNDPLGRFDRVAGLVRDWGARVVDLGAVGYLNPASGFGDWPMADRLIAELQHMASQAAAS